MLSAILPPPPIAPLGNPIRKKASECVFDRPLASVAAVQSCTTSTQQQQKEEPSQNRYNKSKTSVSH
ncbi:hypothetical protein PI124_g1654 [Phytophthora idaei]|nr:hypothetical protein PI125_g1520 [Phytophthora idaei]KAG3173056.1 hypothetical protein PI126_g1039 [Phytophthora idaei]KAG3253770.1 hypothetical protein PI124_g1654 [Phytophthora idaei]